MRLLTPRSPEIEGPFAGTYRAYRPSVWGRVSLQSNATAARPAAQGLVFNLTYSASFMLPALRACIMTAGLLVAPTSLYAACNFEGIPEQYRPYDLSEGTTNSMGQPVIGGEAASTRAERECQEEQDQQSWYQTLGIATDDNTETVFKGVTDSFKAGGSIIFDVAASYQRAYNHPANPDFEPLAWLDENREKYQIDIEHLSLFAGTSSEAEANALLADIHERKAARARMERMGPVTQIATKAIARLPDITVALGIIVAFSIAVRSGFRRTGKPERATGRT